MVSGKPCQNAAKGKQFLGWVAPGMCKEPLTSGLILDFHLEGGSKS